MKTNKGPCSKSYYLKIAVFFLIMYGFGFLPALEPLTPMGMKVIGIFLGLIFAWTTLGLLWPSIAGLLTLVILDTMDLNTAFALGWGSNTLLLILFMTIIAAIVEQSGVSQFIAMWFISRKSIQGKPWLFIFVFLFATMVLSAVTSTIPAILICWSILYSICNQIGYQPKDAFSSFMVVGIVATAALGLGLFPFKTIGITVFGVLENMTGLTVNYLTYVLFTLPIATLCIIVFVLVARWGLRVDVSKLVAFKAENLAECHAKLDKKQRIILGFIVVLIILLLVPSVLPETFILSVILNKIQAAGIAMCLVAVMCCLRIDGSALVDFKEIASKGMQWDVIFLVSVVMPLSTAITSDATGITEFLLNVFGPLFSGRTTNVFLLIVALITILLSNIILQSIAGAILLPVFYSFAMELGIHPLALTSLIVFVCHFGLITPAASPMAALMHGNSDWLKMSDVYKYSIASILSSALVSCVIGIPYIQIVF